ncbi:MAG: nicotinate-nucleotide--dimethylbenzimidazole phosphoribosyltransferase, partial [Lachnospiraceae bacterium]|nr:nicotinate-nucleotide--dimethylbenzimidazole phosphoribosyltransferase [Lachnospiraceae bacterium]
GYDILLTGEMGIGNTTTSSAVSAAILGEDPEVMTGRGAGLDKEGLKRKKKVIREAIDRYALKGSDDILHIMECVGGLDIAGLCGIFLGGALYQIPVVLDGFISATAALCAAKLVPQAVDAMIPSHISKEPAAGLILKELGLSPLLTCDMSLGEGSGAVALMPILDMGHKVYEKMNTFEEIEVEQYQEL